MTFTTVRTEVDVDIDLSQIDVDDLCAELEHRGFKVIDVADSRPISITTQDGEELSASIEDLYNAYTSKSPTFNKLLEDFFDKTIGRIA